MYLAHYFLPFLAYYFKRSKILLFGLLSANLIDLDHIYMRVIGKAAWLGSACEKGMGSNCSIGTYPLHNLGMIVPFILLSLISLVLYRKKRDGRILFLFWLGIGITIHLGLDFIHMTTGFAI